MGQRARRTIVALIVAVVALMSATTSVATAPVLSPAPKRTAWTVARCPDAGRFIGAFRRASLDTGLPVSLLVAVAWVESRMKQDAVSAAGARGLLQVMPATPGIVAVRGSTPAANILAGARYLRRMITRFGGNLELALSAYNAGPTAVAQAGAAPTVGTLRYADNVELRAAQLANCG